MPLKEKCFKYLGIKIRWNGSGVNEIATRDNGDVVKLALRTVGNPRIVVADNLLLIHRE